MGGSSSKSKEVVGIRWNKTIYMAGETASGTIEMNIAAPAGWPAASVQLTISGEEKTHVVYQTTHTTGSGDNQTTVTTTHHAHAKRPLLNLSVVVAQVPGGYLGPGQYSWPFTATLPEGLPSTMTAGHGSSGDSQVKYGAMASLVMGQLPQGAKAPKGGVFGGSTVNIRMKPRDYGGQPMIMVPSSIKVISCCQKCYSCCPCIGCCQPGVLTLGAEVGKKAVCQNEVVPIQVAVHNGSNTTLSALKTVITQEVHWNAQGHAASASLIVAVDTYDPAQCPGATPSPMSKEDRTKAGRVRTANEACKQIVEKLRSGQGQRGSLCISSAALDSYEGQLITVRHFVSVVSSTSGCCTTNPKTKQQIYIQPALAAAVTEQPSYAGASAVESTGMPWEAPGWNPTAAPSYDVFMGDAVMGGVAGDDMPTDHADMPPPSYHVAARGGAKTYASLVAELDASYDDVGAIQRFVEDPEGGAVLRGISPAQFGELVTKVDFSLDQPRAAKILSDNAVPGITTEHLIATLTLLPQDSLCRVDIVRDLGPVCVDIAQNKSKLKQQISDFEAILCGSFLDS
jgi:hypothetical protein